MKQSQAGVDCTEQQFPGVGDTSLPLPWQMGAQPQLVAFLIFCVLLGISVTLTILQECARGFMTIKFNLIQLQ